MRCRVSGESGKLEESMTILRRARTSATETPSSLTTAALRVSAPGSGAGCPGGACAGPRCAGAGSALFEKPARPISTKPNQRIIVIDEQPHTSIGVVKPYTRTPIMSPTSSNSVQCLPTWSRQGKSADRRDRAADFSEVLEHDAGQYRHPGRDIAAADAGLRHGTDKRHAFVLVDCRHGSIEAGARCRRGRHAIDQG